MTSMYQSLYLLAIYYDFNTCFYMLYSYTIMHLYVITLRFVWFIDTFIQIDGCFR